MEEGSLGLPSGFLGMLVGQLCLALDEASNTLLLGATGILGSNVWRGQVVAVDADRGEQLWNVSFPDVTSGLAGHMTPSPIVANGHIYAFDGASLICLQ